MCELVNELKKSPIWKKIHSDENIIDITNYLKQDDIDYSEINALLDFIHSEYGLEKNTITKKLFTSIIMISKFPDDLIGKERGDKEDLIYTKSKEIYQLLLENNINNINKKLITFKIIFNEWKSEDKLNQINLLCEMYYKYTDSLNENNLNTQLSDDEILKQNNDITVTMDNEAKQEYIDKIKEIDKIKREEFVTQINLMRNKILHSLKKLTPNFKKYLKNYELQDVKYDESVYKMFYSKMKYVYWKNIRSDIFEKKDIEIYKHILTDYIELIDSLQLNDLNSSDIKAYLDYDINEDNLINGCITICKLFIKINKSLDSENYDEIYDMLLNKLSDNEQYVTHIFKFCFDRLETIKKIKTTINISNHK